MSDLTPSLEFLCFECPRCHNPGIDIEPYRGDFLLTCDPCREIWYAEFNGEMWINMLLEVDFDYGSDDE